MKRLRNKDCEQYVMHRAEFGNHGGTFWGVDGVPASLGQLPDEWQRSIRRTATTHDVFTVLSYRTPIAWHSSSTGWVIPDVRYSTTTSRHQNIVRRAVLEVNTARFEALLRNAEEAERRLAARRARVQLVEHEPIDPDAEVVPDSTDIVARINEALREIDEWDAAGGGRSASYGDDFEPDNGAAICPPPGYGHFAVSGEAAIYSLEYLQAKYNRKECT